VALYASLSNVLFLASRANQLSWTKCDFGRVRPPKVAAELDISGSFSQSRWSTKNEVDKL
jgi:hypothetical protein